MQKKGLSNLVAEVMLVMLAIAAVIIVWSVIYVIIQNSNERAKFETDYLAVGFILSKIRQDQDGTLSFSIERKSGGGEVAGFIVALEDSSGKSSIVKSFENNPLAELEQQNKAIPQVAHGLAEKIKRIRVYAVLSLNGVVKPPDNLPPSGDGNVNIEEIAPECVADITCFDDYGICTGVCNDGICEDGDASSGSTCVIGEQDGECDGNGVCNLNCASDTNCPDDGNVCTNEFCAIDIGTCSFNYENGVSCGVGGIGTCTDGICKIPGATCGNGVRESGEGCDDGNVVSGDGCDESCQVEAGYQCSGEPSVCYFELSDCGVLNVANGKYILINDPPAFMMPESSSCFNIMRENITLEGNKHRIRSGTGDNIGIGNSVRNSIIRNLTIEGFAHGISSIGRNLSVLTSNISGSTSDGVWVSTGDDTQFINNFFGSNLGGLYLAGNQNKIINNKFISNGIGIYFRLSFNAEVTNNVMCGNGINISCDSFSTGTGNGNIYENQEGCGLPPWFGDSAGVCS